MSEKHPRDEAHLEFWNLIERNRNSLWRFALGLTKSTEDARDLMSDTVLAAYESFPKLRNVVAFRKSIFTIAIRLHNRKRWRQRIFGSSEQTIEIASVENSESRHDLELLRHAIQTLSVRQREAILLFEISGFNLEEIRAIQGGSLSGVKLRLKRGRETLEKMLCEPKVQMIELRNVKNRTSRARSVRVQNQ